MEGHLATLDRLDHLDPASQKALRSAGTPALLCILEDAKTDGLPAPVRTLLEYLSRHLFDPGLNVTTWRREAGVRDHGVAATFRSFVGVSMREYYYRLRVQTAARMLAATDLDEERIGRAVGFTNHRTFDRAYRRWTDRKPGEDRQRPESWLDPKPAQRAAIGKLSAEELHRHVAELYRLHPHVCPEPAPRAPAPAPEVRIVDGRDFERFQADQLWQQVRTLPFEEQKQVLSGWRFHSTVLFDLLRKTSREEGRKDRRRGVDVARLALASLEGHDEIFAERIHDLRARGWTCIANARHLMLDFDGAEEDLKRAEFEWSTPRVEKDLAVSAEIYLVKASLRTCQRRYAEALERAMQSIRLSELAGEPVLQAQALAVGASVKGYTEHFKESASDLRRAAALIDGKSEPFLAFAISLNQANIYARLGDLDSASTSLTEATSRWQGLDDPCGWHRIRHMEGALCELVGDLNCAERSYVEALDGFLGVGAPHLAVLVALELASLDSRQGNLRRAFSLIRWSIPILRSMKLHQETMAAIDLLLRESTAQKIDQSVLKRAVKLFRLDPLVRLNEQARAGRFPRPVCL